MGFGGGKGKWMSQVIEQVEAHYDTVEVPFNRIYQWHQAHLTLECDCGETLTFSGSSAILTCIRVWCTVRYFSQRYPLSRRASWRRGSPPLALRSSKPGGSTPTRRSRLS